jgi:hypothetical protein
MRSAAATQVGYWADPGRAMLVHGPGGSGDQVTSAIRSASRTTGATFDYLLNTAIRESSLDPALRARTSSARELYQFVESTWLA